MVLSRYHPFYSDDVPFASLPCAVRIASPACAMAAGTAGNTPWTQTLQAPNKPGSEQEELRGPSMPSSSGQGCLRSMAGRLCLSGHSVHLQVQQILLPLQQHWLVGRASPATRVSRGSSQHSFHQFHTNCK